MLHDFPRVVPLKLSVNSGAPQLTAVAVAVTRVLPGVPAVTYAFSIAFCVVVRPGTAAPAPESEAQYVRAAIVLTARAVKPMQAVDLRGWRVMVASVETCTAVDDRCVTPACAAMAIKSILTFNSHSNVCGFKIDADA